MKTPWTTVLTAACVASINAAELPKNYKPSPQDFRIVDGVRYNIILSTNWIRIPPRHQSEWTKVVTVIPDGVVFTLIGNRQVPDGPKFLVKNHPDKATLTTGQWIESMILMRVGTFQYSGEVIPMYDYGLTNVGNIKVTDATNRVTTGTNQLSR